MCVRLTCMAYVQVGCCCLPLIALSLKGQEEELAGTGALGQAGENRGSTFRSGNLTCTLPVALMREELVASAYC